MEDQSVETTGYSLTDSTPVPQQRRKSDRQLTLLRVGALMIDQRRELCLIRNVSAGGMMIRAYSSISPGARLSVELKQGERVDGTVKWVKADSVGISFDAPIDIVALIAASSSQGPRPRMPRVDLCCTAWVRQDAAVHRTDAVNISQGGLGIETAGELIVGADVIVSLSGLPPLPGIVKWKDRWRYGIGFNRILAVPDLMGFLKDTQQRRRAPG